MNKAWHTFHYDPCFDGFLKNTDSGHLFHSRSIAGSIAGQEPPPRRHQEPSLKVLPSVLVHRLNAVPYAKDTFPEGPLLVTQESYYRAVLFVVTGCLVDLQSKKDNIPNSRPVCVFPVDCQHRCHG